LENEALQASKKDGNGDVRTVCVVDRFDPDDPNDPGRNDFEVEVLADSDDDESESESEREMLQEVDRSKEKSGKKQSMNDRNNNAVDKTTRKNTAGTSNMNNNNNKITDIFNAKNTNLGVVSSNNNNNNNKKKNNNNNNACNNNITPRYNRNQHRKSERLRLRTSPRIKPLTRRLSHLHSNSNTIRTIQHCNNKSTSTSTVTSTSICADQRMKENNSITWSRDQDKSILLCGRQHGADVFMWPLSSPILADRTLSQVQSRLGILLEMITHPNRHQHKV